MEKRSIFLNYLCSYATAANVVCSWWIWCEHSLCFTVWWGFCWCHLICKWIISLDTCSSCKSTRFTLSVINEEHIYLRKPHNRWCIWLFSLFRHTTLWLQMVLGSMSILPKLTPDPRQSGLSNHGHQRVSQKFLATFARLVVIPSLIKLSSPIFFYRYFYIMHVFWWWKQTIDFLSVSFKPYNLTYSICKKSSIEYQQDSRILVFNATHCIGDIVFFFLSFMYV